MRNTMSLIGYISRSLARWCIHRPAICSPPLRPARLSALIELYHILMTHPSPLEILAPLKSLKRPSSFTSLSLSLHHQTPRPLQRRVSLLTHRLHHLPYGRSCTVSACKWEIRRTPHHIPPEKGSRLFSRGTAREGPARTRPRFRHKKTQGPRAQNLCFSLRRKALWRAGFARDFPMGAGARIVCG
jgi:hypothetical protein